MVCILGKFVGWDFGARFSSGKCGQFNEMDVYISHN